MPPKPGTGPECSPPARIRAHGRAEAQSTTAGAGRWGSVRGLPPSPRRSLGGEEPVAGVVASPLAWHVWVGGRCVNTQAQGPRRDPAPAAQVPARLPGNRVAEALGSWVSAHVSPWRATRAVRERAPDGKNAAAAISPAIQRRIPGPRARGRGAAQHSALSPGATQGHGKRRGDSGTRRPGGFPERMEQIDALRIAGPASPQPALISSSHWLINTVSIKTDRHSPPGSRGKPK